MSSNLYLTLQTTIPLTDWEAFCEEQGIAYSPQTIGGNVYRYGQVEISIDNEKMVVTQGRPEQINHVTFGTYWMGAAIPEVIRIAKAAQLKFGGTFTGAPEVLQPLLEQNA